MMSSTTITTTKWVNCLLLLIPTTTVMIASLILVPTTITHGLSTIDERGGRKLFGGYRITPKFCRASKSLPRSDPRSRGPTICMFNHECAQRDGQVVGACMDGFLFGACCQIFGEIDNHLIQQPSLGSQSNLAVAYETYVQHASNEIKTQSDLDQLQSSPSSVLSNSGSSSGGTNEDDDGGGNNYDSGINTNIKNNGHIISDLSLSNNYYGNNAAVTSAEEGAASDLENEADQGEINMSGSNTISDDHHKPNDFFVNEASVIVSSSTPSPLGDEEIHLSSTTIQIVEKDNEYDMQSPTKTEYSTEIPIKISTSTFSPTYDDSFDIGETTEMPSEADSQEFNEINEFDREPSTSITTSDDDDDDTGELNQSGITYGEAEPVIMDDDDSQFSEGFSTPPTVYMPPTPAEKISYEKPIFKPKPNVEQQTTIIPGKISNVEDNYVLVQTITNDRPPSKRPSESITPNDMESIESIILMLNDTNTGPTYNIETSTKIVTSAVTNKPAAVSTTTQVYQKYDSSPNYGSATQKTATQKSTSTSTSYPSYQSFENQQGSNSIQTQRPYGSTNSLQKDKYSSSYGSNKPTRKPVYTTNFYDKNEPTYTFSSHTNRPTANTNTGFNEQYATKRNTSYLSSNTPSYNDKYGSNFGSSRPQRPQYGSQYGQQNYQTQKPFLSTNSVNKFETYRPQPQRPQLVTSASFAESVSAANNLDYVVTSRPINAEMSTSRPVSSNRPSIISAQTNFYEGSSGNTIGQFSTNRPQNFGSTNSKYPQKDSNLITSSDSAFGSSSYHPTTSRPSVVTRWPAQDRPTPVQQVIQDNQVVISPTRRPVTRPPTLVPKLPSTSYLMGPTPPRPPANIVFTTSTKRPSQIFSASFQSSSPSSNLYTTQFVTSSSYSGSTPKPALSQTYRPTSQDNSYIKVSTTQRPSPTVIITPKPTVNLLTSGSWTQRPGIIRKPPSTTKRPSTSYIFNSLVTKRPVYTTTQTPFTPNIDPASFPVISNDFDDPGYFGSTLANDRPIYESTYVHNIQSTPQGQYTKRPSNRPQHPGFYGTTQPNRPQYQNYYGTTAPPSSGYDSFNVPTASENTDEETYTSPNDFVNFPPVRNPNLNLSATASSVTDEFDLSTPTFVEDNVLKEKMNVLVNKIVQSLQSNFDILTDIVEERNNTITSFQSDQLTTTLRPITTRPTKRTQTRTPTKSPTKTQNKNTTKGPTRTPSKTGTKAPSKTSNKTPTKAPAKSPTNTSKVPNKTTRPPVKSGTKPSSSKVTTIKPSGTKVTKATKAPVTTKKTSQKQSTKKPSSTNSSKRPSSPNRATTQKPSKRPATTTRRPSATKKATTVPTKKVQTKLTTIPTKKPAPQASRRPTKPQKRVPTTTLRQEDEVTGETGAEIETSSEETRQIQCGVRPHVKSGRIVGGKGAAFGEWPWQVLVRESTWLGLFTKNKCGGVLITNKFVITAAHCQPGFLASLVAVFGEFDISVDHEEKRPVTKNVRRVIVHRQYDAATFENDLALLELESPIHYDTHIVPICMPPDDAEYTGRIATVTGWGRLKYGGGVPSILQEVQVPIIENSVCQEMFHTAGHSKKILPSFLCAGYANGQKDSCEGDSGGPLVIQRDDGRWELVGTVSHGIKCAAPFLPGVYMRTSYYKPWIKSITGVK